jgi:peptidoglycan/xylan/chitin deacetylase (PgdA/CDA1 family)
LSAVGVALHRLGRTGRGPGVRILYYHSVSEDPVRSSVSPAAFERQMASLRRADYDLLTLKEAEERLARGERIATRSVVVTLDDGFRDNYEQALPILLRYRVPATVFLTVAYIGTDQLPTLTRTNFVPRPLSWEQVAEMAAHGIQFGSHTLTHPLLTRVPHDEARRQIIDSRRALEDRLGGAVDLFCYPRGDFDASVQALVGEAGYRAACSTLPGVNDRATDRYALRRTYVSRRDTTREFARKLAGGYDLLQQGARLLHRARRR